MAGAGEVCRTCLGAQALAPLFPKPAQYRSYQLALRLSTGLQMDFDDGLPQYICRICNQTVKALLLFRFQSQTANESLCNFYKNKNTNSQSYSATPSEEVEKSQDKSICVKLEKLPSTDDIKLEAKNNLAQFFKKKKNVPKMLYIVSERAEDVTNNLIIEKIQLPKASELLAQQHRLLELYEFNGAIKYARKIDKRTHNSNIDKPTTDIMLEELPENEYEKINEKKNTEGKDAKPIIDKEKQGRLHIKAEFRNSAEVKSENKNAVCYGTRQSLKRKLKANASDTDDDMSDRDDNVNVEDATTYKEDEDCGVDDNPNKWNISLVRDNVLKIKPLIKIHPVTIEAKSYGTTKQKKRTRSTKLKQIKSKTHPKYTQQNPTSSKCTKTTRSSVKITSDKNTHKPTRLRSKRVYFSEDFKRKFKELIKGSFDDKSQNLECKLCENTYRDIQTFKRHAQRHLGYMHVCEYCRRGFENRVMMMKHIKNKHPNGDDIKKDDIIKEVKRTEFRQKCSQLVNGPFNLKSKNIKCNSCCNTYKDYNSFMKHAQRHLGYKHNCEYCTRGFENRVDMVRHIQKRHDEQLRNNPDSAIQPLKQNNIIMRRDYTSEKEQLFREKCMELIEGPYVQNSENIQCKLCHNIYRDIGTFRRHAQRHLGYRYVCEYCQKGYEARVDMVKHIHKKHTQELRSNPNSSIPPPKDEAVKLPEKPDEFKLKCMELMEGPYDRSSRNIQCKICKAFCKNFHSFESHAQIHLGYKHLCEFCAKGFPSRAALKKHLQAFHGFARELSCSYCDFKAVFGNQLKIHERRYHTKERPFVCDICGSGFFSKSVLTQHINHKHQDEKPFECDECPRRFKLHRELNYHKKLIHCPTFTFVCHICEKTFKESKHVRTHYQKTHKIPRDQQVEKILRLYFHQATPTE